LRIAERKGVKREEEEERGSGREEKIVKKR